MTALLLTLAGPLQSWGTSSRFSYRRTDRWPSKSGIIGLLAAAQGKRRTDPLEELLDLRLAVRIEQPGQLERDYQTAARRGERQAISVSTRHYLTDAMFLAAVEGDESLLTGLQEALRCPTFPLYLGRRSCPPAQKIDAGLRAGSAGEALTEEPWQAAPWFQRRYGWQTPTLDLIADCPADEPGAELVRDQPVEGGFDPQHRQWEWRTIRRRTVPNPGFTGDHHEPMAVL
jgi:CRISPR system Cascade subunit CasD